VHVLTCICHILNLVLVEETLLTAESLALLVPFNQPEQDLEAAQASKNAARQLEVMTACRAERDGFATVLAFLVHNGVKVMLSDLLQPLKS